LIYYKKFDKKENQEKRGELYKNIESLKSKFGTFKPIENTSKSDNLIKEIKLSFNISKYTHWLSAIMNFENVNFNENDLIRFIINDKIYTINKLININSFEQTIDVKDELFEEAALLFVYLQEASSGILQRKLNLDFLRARRIIDQLEASGIIGSFNGSQTRNVLISSEIELNQLLNKEIDF
jgi:DNA segregation ATPase FtsK/SpoIIIE-like protein